MNSLPSRNQDVSRVPGRGHYSLRYLQAGRMFSYAHQIDTVVSFEPETVMEVGAGGGVVTAALRAAGLAVTTLDVQPALMPDIVASVNALPCKNETFDVALCSQVLEHLPFEQFMPALRELRRVTRLGLVLSLPDASRHWYLATKLPKMRELRLQMAVPWLLGMRQLNQHFEEFGHYWEIGYSQYPIKLILNAIDDAGWTLESTWRVPELPWHRFFKASNKNKSFRA